MSEGTQNIVAAAQAVQAIKAKFEAAVKEIGSAQRRAERLKGELAKAEADLAKATAAPAPGAPNAGNLPAKK